MVTRGLRQRDLLDALGVGHDVRPGGTGRTVRRPELERLWAVLDLPGEPDGTVADLRTRLREEELGNGDKSGATRLNTSELRRLTRKIETEEMPLDAEAVLVALGTLPDAGDRITVNDSTYEVTGTTIETDARSDAYDEYILFQFAGDRRLALFPVGWDGDVCRYRTSAALEKQVGDPPYRKWVHDEYIDSVDGEAEEDA